MLKLVKCHCTAYCKTILERTGINSMWIINISLDVIHTLEDKQLAINKLSTWDFSTLYTSLPHAKLRLNCMIYWKGSLTPEERPSLLPITFALSGRMIGSLLSTLTSLVGSFAPELTFLSTINLRLFRKLSFSNSCWYTNGH